MFIHSSEFIYRNRMNDGISLYIRLRDVFNRIDTLLSLEYEFKKVEVIQRSAEVQLYSRDVKYEDSYCLNSAE